MAYLTVRGKTLRGCLRDDPLARDHYGGLLLGGGVERKPNRHKLNRKECAMKLTSAQVERILTQFRGEAIPDNDPVIPQLNSLFGEHTFFLDSHGLNIVEPAEAGGSGAKVVNVANWSDADPNRLKPHEPEPTDVVVTLGSKH
jgi:hypothetical protein